VAAGVLAGADLCHLAVAGAAAQAQRLAAYRLDDLGVAVSSPGYEFDPDWTLAPIAIVRECITEGRGGRLATPAMLDATERALFRQVQDKQPFGGPAADLLEKETGVPARMWINLETHYRADLAAGRKDTTDD
jgi:hypothetical protein